MVILVIQRQEELATQMNRLYSEMTDGLGTKNRIWI